MEWEDLKMIVYVLLNYTGDVYGVFTTKQKAQDEAIRLRKYKNHDAYSTFICEVMVDYSPELKESV